MLPEYIGAKKFHNDIFLNSVTQKELDTWMEYELITVNTTEKFLLIAINQQCARH